MAYLPHQQRVVDEKAALDEKLAALGTLIDTNKTYDALPEVERCRLRRQRLAMTSYVDVLGERIDAFSQPVTTSTSGIIAQRV